MSGVSPRHGFSVGDGLCAGLAGAVVGAAPSTVHAVLTGAGLRAATVAAGSILLPRERREWRLIAAGAVVHLSVSLGWGVVLAAMLPRRHTAAAGTAAGLVIAALDLGVVGRRLPRVAALPLGPQLADHLAYGATVGAAVRIRRSKP